jgi:hydrogen peroxide-dependent heme synthase
MTDTQPTSTFAAFWLYRATEARFELEPEDAGAIPVETATILDDHAANVTLRAAYSTIGFSAGADLIFWVVSADMRHVHALAADLHSSAFSAFFEQVQVYAGTASVSQYDPNHGPAFLRGTPPKDYLSVYPFSKTPDWFLLDFEERRRLMVEHGQMGHEYPSILTNTINSFGIADQEFVVALEDDDPATLVKMVQRLRAAEVRKYTALDTPIFLGLKMPVEEAISVAL